MPKEQEKVQPRNKRLDVTALVGGMTAKKGERITDTMNQSLLNTEQIIKVSLNKIYVSKQIRLKIHQDKVDDIVSTYPLRNYPEIRKVDPVIDGDSVPAGYEYVLLTGEHRYHALLKLKFQEHDFKFVPPSLIKTKADVIKYQFIENNVRADMHFIEKAHSLLQYIDESNCSKTDAALILGINASVVSRMVRVAKYFSDKDNQYVLDNNITSERVLVGISKLIELGHTDWLSIVKPHALNSDGVFDPSLLYESTLNQIIKDLTAPPEPEQKPEPVAESPKQLADSIVPNAFKEESEPAQKSVTTTSPVATANQETSTPTETSLDDTPVHVPNTTTQQENVTPVEKGSSVGEEHSPAPSPTTISPATAVVEKQSSLKLAAQVLQQVLEGKEVEEILMKLGPDLKAVVSEDDGADIYEMIQNFPFN